MNAESNSGAEPETQTPPTGEAGCETEIDRNVLGTVAATGLAEWLREIEADMDDDYAILERCNIRIHMRKGMQAKIRSILDAKDETW